MAELHVQQGLLEDAISIYQKLLDREPEQQSWRHRIDELRAKAANAGGVSISQLVRLLDSLKRTSSHLNEVIQEIERIVNTKS